MMTKAEIESLHHKIDTAVRAAFGPQAIAVTCISVNGKESGQWVLCHPGHDKGEVAKRLGICATVLTDPIDEACRS